MYRNSSGLLGKSLETEESVFDVIESMFSMLNESER